MSATAQAKDQAKDQAKTIVRSTWLERLTRAGFLGYGITHLLLAWVALRVATQSPATDMDQSGGLQMLTGGTFGGAIVLLIAIGFAAMALWQALLTVVGHPEHRGKRLLFERLSSAGRTILYAYLGWTAWKVAKGTTAGGDAQQQGVSDLMSRPYGATMVMVAGVMLTLFGIALAVYGWQKHFLHHLRTGEMSTTLKRTSKWLGVVGYLAKGAAYGAAGVLLTIAGSTYDPEKGRGLDAALRTLAAQPYGGLLLTIVAVGLAAFGVFCFVQARYRKV